MANRFAFFDVDETLLTFKSMFEFRRRLFLDTEGDAEQARQRYEAFRRDAQALGTTLDRSLVNRWFYRGLAGRTERLLRQVAQQWHAELMARGVPVFVPEVVTVLAAWRAQGFEPVAVSGSAEIFVAPFLDTLNIAHRLCIRLEAREGVLTGDVLPPQTIGAGKREAVQQFLREHRACADECRAAGDHHTDLPMLDLVGQALVVAGDPVLETEARARNWTVITPRRNRIDLARWLYTTEQPGKTA